MDTNSSFVQFLYATKQYSLDFVLPFKNEKGKKKKLSELTDGWVF